MTKRALCVGINDYSLRPGFNSLPDARQDGEAWAALLPNSFGFDAADVTLLTDQNATRSAVMAALTTMFQQCQAGDVVCYFHAGHGGRKPDGNGGYYETICCADANGDIRDSEISALAASLQPSIANFTIVLDSCHSGGVFDPPPPGETMRCIPWSADEAAAMAAACNGILPHVSLSNAQAMQNNVSVTKDNDGSMKMTINEDLNYSDSAKATLLAACRYDQLSGGTGSHGKFTQALLDIINSSNFQITHPDLLDKVRQAIARYTSTQTPQLRGRPIRLEENFLAGWNYSV